MLHSTLHSWQDFMFACSMYPADPATLASVGQEVEHQVRRLQHHPSIALWAANNENAAALRSVSLTLLL